MQFNVRQTLPTLGRVLWTLAKTLLFIAINTCTNTFTVRWPGIKITLALTVFVPKEAWLIKLFIFVPLDLHWFLIDPYVSYFLKIIAISSTVLLKETRKDSVSNRLSASPCVLQEAIECGPVRIRVSIGPTHLLAYRKRRLNRAVLRMRPEKPRSRVTVDVARLRSLPVQLPRVRSIALDIAAFHW
jgi:hypothetical protein